MNSMHDGTKAVPEMPHTSPSSCEQRQTVGLQTGALLTHWLGYTVSILNYISELSLDFLTQKMSSWMRSLLTFCRQQETVEVSSLP